MRFFNQVNVRNAIETHLLDSSPQVRDAAVELIGKYVVSIPEVAGDYYDQIADRIAVRCWIILISARTITTLLIRTQDWQSESV